MKIVTLATLKAELDRGQRLLGLDLGAKTIGLALSDPDLCIASPLKTLRRQKFSLDAQHWPWFAPKIMLVGWWLACP